MILSLSIDLAIALHAKNGLEPIAVLRVAAFEYFFCDSVGILSGSRTLLPFDTFG
eukprot:CAMPEP_0169299682 /NCGR_PEP_ID=MMETSP1016-20121227/67217_1 /TAXON_ID=342587 /ORGANISM="Karlodinium micrum, Strain CCMP2283" /LENGTH=54 /DNA_ID=CAMNT_0009391983 /DNA_START=1 /DNA_END=162 /DNA_ORIENTATION=+